MSTIACTCGWAAQIGRRGCMRDRALAMSLADGAAKASAGTRRRVCARACTGNCVATDEQKEVARFCQPLKQRWHCSLSARETQQAASPSPILCHCTRSSSIDRVHVHRTVHVSEQMSMQITTNMSRHMSGHRSRHMSEHMSRHMSRHMSIHMSVKMSAGMYMMLLLRTYPAAAAV